MGNLNTLFKGGIVLMLVIFSNACVLAEPREGYWDRDHARYYHDHSWHDCGERSDFCH